MEWKCLFCLWLPGIGAVFHSFLAVLAPSIAIVQVIHFALCHERKSWLSLLLLVLLFGFQPDRDSHIDLFCAKPIINASFNLTLIHGFHTITTKAKEFFLKKL